MARMQGPALATEILCVPYRLYQHWQPTRTGSFPAYSKSFIRVSIPVQYINEHHAFQLILSDSFVFPFLHSTSTSTMLFSLF